MKKVALVAGVLALVGQAGEASAICREVTVIGSAEPSIDPDQAVMFIREENVPLGDCMQPPPMMGGGEADAGAVGGDGGADGGVDDDAGPDGGVAEDAGPGGAEDAGPPVNECRIGNAVTLIVQPNFSTGPDGSRFALLMATPAAPVISLGPEDLFARLWEETRPLENVIEVEVEDEALGYQCRDPKWNSGGCSADFGWGVGTGTPSVPDPPAPGGGDGGLPEGPTLIGGYEVAVLGSGDLGVIVAWLQANQYAYTQEDLDAVAPYLAAGHTLVAVRVAVEGEVERGAFRPLAFTWEGSEVKLPAGISRRAGGGELAVVAYVAANVRLNLEGAHVSYARLTWNESGERRFLTRNELYVDLSKGMESDPGVTTGDLVEHQDVVDIVHEVRIPSSECPDDGDGLFGCGCAAGRRTGVPGLALLVGFAAVVVMRLTRRKR